MSAPAKGTVRYNFDVERRLRDDFVDACKAQYTAGSHVLRAFMAQYVLEYQRSQIHREQLLQEINQRIGKDAGKSHKPRKPKR